MQRHPGWTRFALLLALPALGASRASGADGARGARGAGRYAPVNGMRLYYEVHGAPHRGAPPLVLLHGGGSTIATSFGKLLPILARTRQVIAFEQQGHGRTADVDRPFTFEQSADDAVALLRHLGVERADLFGYSNGGSIALQVAIRHPEVVRRLVVASAMYRRDGMEPQFWEGMRHAKLEEMPPELREAYLRVAPRPQDLPIMFQKCVQRMLAFEDWPAESIRSIQAPALVVVGDADVVRPEHAVELFRLLPAARLAVLPGTDHMKLPARTAWQAAMVEEFLDAAAPATATAPARPPGERAAGATR
jgi:pimeloyl-ACP methyl ester carboxylesterase